MMGLNNKGQTLVMFVVLIPIFLFIVTLVYDIGNALYEKEKLSNINYMTILYGLQNIDSVDENDLIDIIMSNTDNLSKISVMIEDNFISVKLDKNIKGILGGVFGFNILEVRSQYEGKIIDEEIKIERIKWYYGW